MSQSSKTFLALSFVWFAFVTLMGLKSFKPYLAVGADFDIYYFVGELFKSGFQSEIYNFSEMAPMYAYPPLGSPVFFLFTILPIKLCKIVFFVLKLFLFFLWPYLLLSSHSHASKQIHSRSLLGAIAASVFVSPSVYEDFMVGNLHVIFITILIISMKCLKGRELRLGVALLVPLVMLKPHYAFFVLPFLLQNFLTTVRIFLVLFGILSSSSLIFYSPSELGSLCLHWIEIVKNPIAGPFDSNNMALQAVITRILTQFNLDRLIHFAASCASVFFTLSCFIILYFLRNSKKRKENFYQSNALLIYSLISIFMLVFSPVVWMTYLVLLIFPVYCLMDHWPKGKSLTLGSILIGFTFSLFVAGNFFQSKENLRIFGRTYALPQIFIFLIVIILILEFYQEWKQGKLSCSISRNAFSSKSSYLSLKNQFLRHCLGKINFDTYISHKRVLKTLLLGSAVIISLPVLVIFLKICFPPSLRAMTEFSAHVVEWRVGNRAFLPYSLDEELYFHSNGEISGSQSKRFLRWWMDDGILNMRGESASIRFKYDGLGFVAYLAHSAYKMPYFLKVKIHK